MFSILWLLVLPYMALWTQLDVTVTGAWIGGSIDLTGAVVASAAVVGPQAEEVAAIVKMAQNSALGIYMLLIALLMSCKRLWPQDEPSQPKASDPIFYNLWKRFPKFVLGIRPLVQRLLCQ